MIFKLKSKKELAAFRFIAGGMVCFGAFLFIFLLFFTEPFFYMAGIISESVSLVLFLVFLFFYLLNLHNYSLKYFFLGKDFKKQLNKILPFFEGCSLSFKKQLMKDCKETYRVFGIVLKFSSTESDSLFKKQEEKEVLKKVINNLLISIKDGSGWNGFIDSCDKNEFSYRRKHISEDFYVMDPLDGWEIMHLLNEPIYSYSFRYLASSVYKLTDFTFIDNDLDKEYSHKLEQNKSELINCQNKILVNFQNELERVNEILNKGISNIDKKGE